MVTTQALRQSDSAEALVCRCGTRLDSPRGVTASTIVHEGDKEIRLAHCRGCGELLITVGRAPAAAY